MMVDIRHGGDLLRGDRRPHDRHPPAVEDDAVDIHAPVGGLVDQRVVNDVVAVQIRPLDRGAVADAQHLLGGVDEQGRLTVGIKLQRGGVRGFLFLQRKIECAFAQSPRASGLRSSIFLSASCASFARMCIFLYHGMSLVETTFL